MKFTLFDLKAFILIGILPKIMTKENMTIIQEILTTAKIKVSLSGMQRGVCEN